MGDSKLALNPRHSKGIGFPTDYLPNWGNILIHKVTKSIYQMRQIRDRKISRCSPFREKTNAGSCSPFSAPSSGSASSPTSWSG